MGIKLVVNNNYRDERGRPACQIYNLSTDTTISGCGWNRKLVPHLNSPVAKAKLRFDLFYAADPLPSDFLNFGSRIHHPIPINYLQLFIFNRKLHQRCRAETIR